MAPIDKLLSISGNALGGPLNDVVADAITNFGSLAVELADMLTRKNGFYAFESALHVFPMGESLEGEMTLLDWNNPRLWRHEFGDLADKKLFFAEDACGNQFCIYNNLVGMFESEIGSVEPLASSINEWAAKVLGDFDVLTGYSMIHAWQADHGPIRPGQRLTYRTPLVLGGEYSLSNVYASDVVEIMTFRGYIASQIRDLPDGAQVEIRWTD